MKENELNFLLVDYYNLTSGKYNKFKKNYSFKIVKLLFTNVRVHKVPHDIKLVL